MALGRRSRRVARSDAMQKTLCALSAAAQAGGGVLLVGEAGSGRGHLAAVFHAAVAGLDSSLERLLRRSVAGRLAPDRYVIVDCADAGRIEQVLFGTSPEVETGGETPETIVPGSAVDRADGGTLVFRQIAEMPGRVQLRLARLLRDGEVVVTGADGSPVRRTVTIRPVTIVDAVVGDAVTPDLLRRLAHTTVSVPPLRDRRADIAPLVRCLLADACTAAQQPAKVMSDQAMALLTALPWRGNLVDLETCVRQVTSRVPGRVIRLTDVLATVRLDGPASAAYGGTLKEARERFEREYVGAVLDQHRGRMADAAKVLGLQRTNLYRKVRQLALPRKSSRHQLSFR